MLRKSLYSMLFLLFVTVTLSGCLDVDVGEITQFSITSFTVQPALIKEGQTANLSWIVMSAQTVRIDPGIGNVSNIGTRIIQPTETTTYTLTAVNGTKILTATTETIVNPASNTNQQDETNQTSITNPVAIIDTSKGVIKVELFQDKLPITCGNFIKLVNDEFYDGMIFHRVMDDFMIQAGSTYPDGSTEESPYGNIEFETDDEVLHEDGAISMASTGAGVGGSSQFFICDGKQSGLDGYYATFGIVIEGIDVVRDIADEPHDNSYGSVGGGRPNEDIIIYSITIEV